MKTPRNGAEPSTPAEVDQRVILLEFNELCPNLLTRWMDEGLLPNFKRLYDRSDIFTTLADVDDPGQLEPWIQWYSTHTGLAYDQHRVFHLTDGPRAKHLDIYQHLLAAGRTVGSFASMNVAPFAGKGSFFVADPWSENGDAHPKSLNIYNRFVSNQVREYSNSRNRLGLADYRRFLAFTLTNGLTFSTINAIAKQLISERVYDRRLSYRRVAILDRIQYDIFSHIYTHARPQFATFFLNSTAHLQHSYWRHLEPEAFSFHPAAEEVSIYRNAVRFGYEAMDGLIGKFLSLAERQGAMLIMMSALSQQPFLRHEESGGQHFYRLHDARSFMHGLGIEFGEVDPTMTHQYFARFAGAAAAVSARARLEALKLEDGQTLFGFADVGTDDTGLYFGCQISSETDVLAAVIDEATGTRFEFGTILYAIEATKSGRHHPHGALWIETGRGRVHNEPVSILDVFPTLIDLLNAPQPDGEHRGRSLEYALAA